MPFFSLVPAGGSHHTRDRHETRLFEQQDPGLQVDTAGDPHPLNDPFQPDEGPPHGGCGGQAVQKVVRRSPQPLV